MEKTAEKTAVFSTVEETCEPCNLLPTCRLQKTVPITGLLSIRTTDEHAQHGDNLHAAIIFIELIVNFQIPEWLTKQTKNILNLLWGIIGLAGL